jgi:phosphoesterase RecJ-like protein
MKALTLDEICDLMLRCKHPLILTHCRPDGDTVGSAAALCHLFSALGIPASLCCPDSPGARLSFLVEGIEMTSAEDLDSREVITVDVASPGQLGSLADAVIERSHLLFMLDHHERGVLFADHYVRPDAAATGEILFDLAERLVSRSLLSEIPRAAADAIFAAISSDTGCFRYSNTTAYTHEIAARLISLGVDAAEINRLLFDIKSKEIIRVEGYVGSHILLHESGRIAWVTLPYEVRDFLGVRDEHLETAIDIVRQLEGVEIAIVIKQIAEDTYKASLRSIGADVSAIAASLGGGGHIRAAGCAIKAASADEAALRIVERAAEALGIS